MDIVALFYDLNNYAAQFSGVPVFLGKLSSS